MANKSSFMLALLLIANPFMLLFFQNCSPSPHSVRAVASTESPITVDKADLNPTK